MRIRSRILFLVLLLTAAGLTAGCELFGLGEDSPLADTTWELQSFTKNGESVVISPQNTYELAFSSESVGAVADCQECSGSYQVENSEISITLVCSGSECAPPTKSLQFRNALLAAETYELEENELLIHYNLTDETGGTLTFRRAE